MFQKPNKKLGIVSLAFFISIFFTSCDDKSYFEKTYNEKLLNQEITCLQLNLEPYSHEVYEKVKTLYRFKEDCQYILTITYKTDIGCNSKFNTNKEYNSFIDMTLSRQNKKIYTLYKDIKKDEPFMEKLEEVFISFKNKINL